MRGLLALLILFAVFGESISAQTEPPGIVVLTIRDTSNSAPVDNARVLLDGPEVLTGFSDAQGKVEFDYLPDGIYRARILKSGYSSTTSDDFEVLEGRLIRLHIALQPSEPSQEAVQGMKVIANVTSKATVETSTIDQNSDQRMLSSDLIGALGKLSGVQIQNGNYGSETISLGGHDADQTAITVNGIQVNAPGSAGNVANLPSDLLTSASVSFSPRAGALGGSVNFGTAQPTFTWRGNLQLATTSIGGNNYNYTETGSIKKLGIAIGLSQRFTPSIADGMRYTDTSGLNYVHEGDSNENGQILNLRYRIDNTHTLSANFIGSETNREALCLAIIADLPCGIGPGNTVASGSATVSLSDDLLVGSTNLHVSLNNTRGYTGVYFYNRYVAGALSPSASYDATTTRGFSIQATLPAKQHHTLSVQIFGNLNSDTLTPLDIGAVPYYNSSDTTSSIALQLNDTIHSNAKLSLNDSFALTRGSAAPSSILITAGAQWNPTRADSFSGSYAIGNTAPLSGLLQVLTDPASAGIDCSADIVTGGAPGAPPASSTSFSANLSYTHRFGGNSSVNVGLSRQIQDGAVRPMLENGTTLAALGIFPPGYLNAIENIVGSQAGCGAVPPNFGYQNLYFYSRVGDLQRLFENITINGYFAIKNFVIQPFFDINVSTLYSNSPLVNNAYSIVAPGSQLAQFPTHRAGVTIDYKAKHSIFEYVADAQYTGSDNFNYLPPYVTIDAGINARLTRGTLTFAIQNITNTYAGIFSSYAYSVPQYTLGGILVPQIADPLPPRSFSFTYNVKMGQPTPTKTK